MVLATGTFLGGRMFRGDERHEGGRIGERAARKLAEQLRALALPLSRLKTGTPPRIDGRTIDWARLDEQPSDTDPWTMSPMTTARLLPQVACAITRTNGATHDAIRSGLDRSPLFGGRSRAGPTLLPVDRGQGASFGDRDGHQVFLEPEGLDDATVYPNGLSTSLPVDVQTAMIRSIAGLERAAITLPGYAVNMIISTRAVWTRRLRWRRSPASIARGRSTARRAMRKRRGRALSPASTRRRPRAIWSPAFSIALRATRG